MNAETPSIPPMPSNFGLRYVAWFLWCNAITLLQILQLAVGSLALATDMFSHNAIVIFLVVNSILNGAVAVIKRNNPPGPAPTRPA